MTEPSFRLGAPRKILLATDLSARSDRALERAMAIARRHDAHLVIVHAFEEPDESMLTEDAHGVPSWSRPPDLAPILKQRVHAELRADLGAAVEKATILVEEGNPAEVIEQVAASTGADLIIAGIARKSPLSIRPAVLGKTVEQLLRRQHLPILIVRNRAREQYQHIVVTTDFSQPSAHALQMALSFFPLQPLHLLHASESPYPAFAPDTGLRAESFQALHAQDLERFLSSIYLPEPDRGRVRPLIEPGPPRQIIREYVLRRGADLVVLGTHGRGAVLETFLGSTAKGILATLPCDALVVRGPRS